MEQNDAKITIIGVGVVGLAIAFQLSKKYDSIFVVEKNNNFGEETSARSSEVVHSGIYYPSDSLKTKLCIEGRELLYDFCDEFDVTYNKCGKLIIAVTEEDLEKLDIIKKQAFDNGVDNIRKLSREETLYGLNAEQIILGMATNPKDFLPKIKPASTVVKAIYIIDS